MAGETQTPSLGYKDQFHLHNGTVLYKLRGVTGFDVPTGGSREQVEVTDLDAEDWRRAYISGFYEDVDFEVTLNARFLSDTDILLTDANGEGDARPFKAVLAQQGVLVAQVEGTCRCTGYVYDRVAVGEVKTATATFRAVSVDAVATYVASGA